MRNLHKISTSGLSDEIKLLITNWHIDRVDNPNRRVGKIQYVEGKFLLWDRSADGYYLTGEVVKYSMESWLAARNIPLSYFKEDMVYNA